MSKVTTVTQKIKNPVPKPNNVNENDYQKWIDTQEIEVDSTGQVVEIRFKNGKNNYMNAGGPSQPIYLENGVIKPITGKINSAFLPSGTSGEDDSSSRMASQLDHKISFSTDAASTNNEIQSDLNESSVTIPLTGTVPVVKGGTGKNNLDSVAVGATKNIAIQEGTLQNWSSKMAWPIFMTGDRTILIDNESYKNVEYFSDIQIGYDEINNKIYLAIPKLIVNDIDIETLIDQKIDQKIAAALANNGEINNKIAEAKTEIIQQIQSTSTIPEVQKEIVEQATQPETTTNPNVKIWIEKS